MLANFVQIDDFNAAQRIADRFAIDKLHRILDRIAYRYCPIIKQLQSNYHWTLMQVEYATDIVFLRQSVLGPLYETIIRTAIHTVKASNVATFLGRKLNGNYKDELGNDFNTRIEGNKCIN